MRKSAFLRALCIGLIALMIASVATPVAAQTDKKEEGSAEEESKDEFSTFEVPAGSEPGDEVEPLEATPAPADKVQEPTAVESSPPTSFDELGEVESTGKEPEPELKEERTDLRTAASDVWETEDDGMVLRSFDDLKYFEVEEGKFEPIDVTLVKDDKREGWVETKANGFSVRFGPLTEDGPIQLTTAAGKVITLTPQLPDESRRGAKMVVDEKASSVTYLEVFPGVDLRYTATPSGLKEDVILNKPGKVTSFETLVEGVELGSQQESESGLFLPVQVGEKESRESGSAVSGGLGVGNFVVEDARGVPVDAEASGSRIAVAKVEGAREAGSVVTTEVSADWLAKQPEDAFPIVIDPFYFAAWAAGPTGGGLGSRYPGSGYFNGHLRVGDSNPAGGPLYWRGQVRFTQSWDGQTTFDQLANEGWGVTGAGVKLTFGWGTQTQRTIKAGWSGTETQGGSSEWSKMYPGNYASEYDKAVVGGSSGGNGGVPNDWTIPVTNLVRKWLNEEVTGTPWISLAGDETTTDDYAYKKFSQAAIHIWFVKKPSRPVPSTPADNSVLLDTTPTLTAIASGPQYSGQPIAHWFRVSTSPGVDDGNIVADSGWTGSTSWTVPEGILQDGVKYYWNVKALDTTWGIYHNSLPENFLSFTINLRLGTGDATQPYESFGPGTVNLANGNYNVSVGTAGFNTLGGAVAAGLTYNTQEEAVHGLTGTYYFDDNKNGLVDNGELPVMSRIEHPKFYWGTGAPVTGHGRKEDFIVHWDGFLRVPYDGVYQISPLYNDGAKVVLDGVTAIDKLDGPASGWKFGPNQTLSAGDPIPIHIEYREKTGDARFDLAIRCISGDCLSKWPGQPAQWHCHVNKSWLSPTPQTLPEGWTLGTTTSGGRGWVSATAAGKNVVLKDSSGTKATFEHVSDGSWKPPEGNFSTLTKPAGSGYVLSGDDGFTYIFGTDGKLVETSSPLDAAHPTRTISVFSNNRLTALKDPVSQRQIEFRYYGSDVCPDTPTLANGAAGRLCQIRYPDTVNNATATSIWYVGGLISEIRNPGDERYRFGWTNGKLTSLIDPFVNDALRYSVAGVPESQADWEIAYTGDKVSQVTSPKPTASGVRSVGKIIYNGLNATLQTKGLSVVNQFGSTRTVYWDSELRVYKTTGADGTEVSQGWNDDDTLSWSRDSAERQTTYHYDDLDRLTDTYGPAPYGCFDLDLEPFTTLPASCAGVDIAHVETGYDEALSGLAVSVYDNRNLASSPTSFGRDTDSALSASHSFVPSGTDWSVRYEGKFKTTGGPSNDTYTAWFHGGIRIYVDHVLVVDEWDENSGWNPATVRGTLLSSGWHDIRIDYRPATNGSKGFMLRLGGSPGAGSTLSGNNVSALYNLATSNTVYDDGGATPTTSNESTYAEPWLGLASGTSVDPTGLDLESSVIHEATYNRRTSRTMPDGTTWHYEWYGATQAPVSNTCNGVATQQAGMAKKRYYQNASNRPDFYVYDNMGRQIGSRVGTSGAWTCSSLDDRGRTLRVDHPGSRITYYSYAPNNNPLFSHIGETIGGVDQGTISTKYDLLGREVFYHDTVATVTSTAYDQAGRVTSSTTTKSGTSITNGVTYDVYGRMKTQTINGVTAATVNYDADGEVSGYVYNHGANTTTATISRDDRQGAIGGVVYALNGSTLSETVTRSQSGRIKSHTTGGTGWNYVYDGVGRLKSGTRGSDVFSYLYDANSNRDTANLNGTAVSYTYNSLDRLTGFTGMSGSIGYDSHGNTTSLDGMSLGWDPSDRNISISKPGTSVSYNRDMTDRIRIRTENGVASTYLFDGSGDSPAGITAPGSSTVLEWYVSLPGGVMRTVKAGAADVWLYPNLHGDTLVTVNALGQKASGPFVYGPYGEQIGASQADVTGLSADYGWVGEHLKATETALDNIVQMGARPYHPGLGRFLAVDPVEGGTPNDYVYVTDPVNSFDLNGMGIGGWLKDKGGDALGVVKAVVSDPVGSVGRAGEWAHENRSQIAMGLALLSLTVSTGGAGLVLLGAATAAGAYDAYHTCKEGDAVGCGLGIAATVTGGVGGAMAFAGRATVTGGGALIKAGNAAREGVVVSKLPIIRSIVGSGRIGLGSFMSWGGRGADRLGTRLAYRSFGMASAGWGWSFR